MAPKLVQLNRVVRLLRHRLCREPRLQLRRRQREEARASHSVPRPLIVSLLRCLAHPPSASMVAQADSPTPAVTHSPSPSPTTTDPENDEGLSADKIVGIVLGPLGFIATAITLIYTIKTYNRKKRSKAKISAISLQDR